MKYKNSIMYMSNCFKYLSILSLFIFVLHYCKAYCEIITHNKYFIPNNHNTENTFLDYGILPYFPNNNITANDKEFLINLYNENNRFSNSTDQSLQIKNIFGELLINYTGSNIILSKSATINSNVINKIYLNISYGDHNHFEQLLIIDFSNNKYNTLYVTNNNNITKYKYKLNDENVIRNHISNIICISGMTINSSNVFSVDTNNLKLLSTSNVNISIRCYDNSNKIIYYFKLRDLMSSYELLPPNIIDNNTKSDNIVRLILYKYTNALFSKLFVNDDLLEYKINDINMNVCLSYIMNILTSKYNPISNADIYLYHNIIRNYGVESHNQVFNSIIENTNSPLFIYINKEYINALKRIRNESVNNNELIKDKININNVPNNVKSLINAKISDGNYYGELDKSKTNMLEITKSIIVYISSDNDKNNDKNNDFVMKLCIMLLNDMYINYDIGVTQNAKLDYLMNCINSAGNKISLEVIMCLYLKVSGIKQAVVTLSGLRYAIVFDGNHGGILSFLNIDNNTTVNNDEINKNIIIIVKECLDWCLKNRGS